MKKLMIVAAVAAMVGGAFANTAYTFSATVKTTVGKQGKATTTYGLGQDANGDWWYADRAVQALIATNSNYFTTKRVGNSSVPTLSNKAKKDVEWLNNNIVPLANTYNVPETYRGREMWCETFKITQEACYRVAGTEKFTDIVVGDMCCGQLTGTNFDIDDTVVLGSVQRFGGASYPSAKKAEIFASVTENAQYYGLGPSVFLAGQGSIGKVLDNDGVGTIVTVEGVTSLSGNIVGTIEAPECDVCCGLDGTSIAFDCASGSVLSANDDTAFYGSFSIKYNAKETKAL